MQSISVTIFMFYPHLVSAKHSLYRRQDIAKFPAVYCKQILGKKNRKAKSR